MQYPRLRNAEKIKPPYPLGRFPSGFLNEIGKEIVYLLATKATPSLEGSEWERIFAQAIGAEWKPSAIGLDDVICGNCAWSAKTVKGRMTQKTVRLISGRNSPTYSFNEQVVSEGASPEKIGREVLVIWNARVEEVRSRFPHMRTVVLIKSDDLLNLRIFEVETKRYDPELFTWKWNKNNNLEGARDGVHCFTWQPHGSQFTIIENIPDSCINFRIRKPKALDKDAILKEVGYCPNWIEILAKE